MIGELKRVIDQVAREKGVDHRVLVKTLEDAVKTAAKKVFGPNFELEVRYNDELGEIEVFEFKEVVKEVKDPNLEISYEEAKKIDPECEMGDSLGIKMGLERFSRIAAQTAKQVIIQRLREAERNIIYTDFKDRKGEIVNGIVQRIDRGSIMVNLGRTEAELPVSEQIPNDTYKQGDRIRAYILDVKQYSKGPQIILSRTHPNFLAALFEAEVPEIAEGIVKIVQVVREPGSRAKIAVTSKDPDVDPVGACVGLRGTRVQAVVQELRGEKIDIVVWDKDPARFVCNALAPAEIVRVVVDEGRRSMEVVVPDDQLSLAIGKRGQNVRLAARLTGWNLDVIDESTYSKRLREGYESLISIKGINEALAAELTQYGYRSARELSLASPSDLAAIPGIDEETAKELIVKAREYVIRKESGELEK
ncbi:MAG: transcription termination factor NusA [Desulfatiglandales bacterium]